MGSLKVAAAAKKWSGKDFKPGVGEQCMGFVREVLHEAGSPLKNAVTKKAVDGLDTSYYLASSLAGRDLAGSLVDKISALEPGSVVFFEDTYGEWPAGTITHVGIYVGDGVMVHRPTMARPVESVPLAGHWAAHFRCGLVLPADEKAVGMVPATKPPVPNRDKVNAHSGRAQLMQNGKPRTDAEYVITVKGGKVTAKRDGKPVPFTSLTFEIVH